jgi:RNA polymerase sigma-70 factor (ECF subfamily)
MVLTSARLRLRMQEILREDHADVTRRALRLNMQGAWAVNRQPDMRRPDANGTPGASQAAGADQPAGRHASTGRDAPEELFTACYPRLAGWVRRLVDTDEDAHDIAGEAFARLLSRWSRVDDPHSYLYMIATNLVSDHWRKTGRERRTISKLTGAAAGASYHQAQESDVRVLIEALPPRLRAAFLLHHYAGFEVRQIAAMTGRPEGTIKADLHHARIRLKAALADTGGDPAPGR